MFHLQSSTEGWLEAIEGDFPFMVKAVDRGDLLVEAKRTNPNCRTVLRHWYDQAQVPGPTVENNLPRARDFLATFIDGTFLEKYAAYTDFVEGWNEYLSDSQEETERIKWVAWAEALCQVWYGEYRVQHLELAHIDLILCNTAVGNDIDKRFMEIAVRYGAVIGYHPYSHYIDKVRDSGDWQYFCGRWNGMEQAAGIKPRWAFTEAGPFESVKTGWRSSHCLGGDSTRYALAVYDWIQEIKQTDAFKEGRILGFALFTTGGGKDWAKYETRQPEMNLLSEVIRREWVVPEPEPEPEPQEEKVKAVILDVSKHQGEIDWAAVKAWRGPNGEYVQGVAIRASVGHGVTTNGRDLTFERNWNGAGAVGLKRTAYHVNVPDQDVARQCQNFFEAMGDRVPDFPPVLDVEIDNGMTNEVITKSVGECLAIIGTKYRRVLTYTGAWFWNPNLTMESASAMDQVSEGWFANYPDLKDPTNTVYLLAHFSPRVPFGWSNWQLWQFTNSAKLPGVTANTVDMSVFNGTPEEFEEYCAAYAAEINPPKPKPEPKPVPAHPTWALKYSGYGTPPEQVLIKQCQELLGENGLPRVSLAFLVDPKPEPKPERGRG